MLHGVHVLGLDSRPNKLLCICKPMLSSVLIPDTKGATSIATVCICQR